MTKDEALKQWVDDVSKVYDILAFGHTERAVEILAKTRNAMREALAQPQQEPCDMGDICIGCSPRNADGSCPGAQPEPVA
jgi:hypothetical protein